MSTNKTPLDVYHNIYPKETLKNNALLIVEAIGYLKGIKNFYPLYEMEICIEMIDLQQQLFRITERILK